MRIRQLGKRGSINPLNQNWGKKLLILIIILLGYLIIAISCDAQDRQYKGKVINEYGITHSVEYDGTKKPCKGSVIEYLNDEERFLVITTEFAGPTKIVIVKPPFVTNKGTVYSVAPAICRNGEIDEEPMIVIQSKKTLIGKDEYWWIDIYACQYQVRFYLNIDLKT